MDGMAILIILVAGLALAGYGLPRVLGDSYYYQKWRLVAILCAVGFIFILLTPHGCSIG